jgi:hypothetical protein
VWFVIHHQDSNDSDDRRSISKDEQVKSEEMADYASLQKLALADTSQDEAVTVNQRALIGIADPVIPSSFPPPSSFLPPNPVRQNPSPLCLRQHNSPRTLAKRRRRKRNPRQNPLPDPLPCTDTAHLPRRNRHNPLSPSPSLQQWHTIPSRGLGPTKAHCRRKP